MELLVRLRTFSKHSISPYTYFAYCVLHHPHAIVSFCACTSLFTLFSTFSSQTPPLRHRITSLTLHTNLFKQNADYGNSEVVYDQFGRNNQDIEEQTDLQRAESMLPGVDMSPESLSGETTQDVSVIFETEPLRAKVARNNAPKPILCMPPAEEVHIQSCSSRTVVHCDTRKPRKPRQTTHSTTYNTVTISPATYPMVYAAPIQQQVQQQVQQPIQQQVHQPMYALQTSSVNEIDVACRTLAEKFRLTASTAQSNAAQLAFANQRLQHLSLENDDLKAQLAASMALAKVSQYTLAGYMMRMSVHPPPARTTDLVRQEAFAAAVNEEFCQTAAYLLKLPSNPSPVEKNDAKDISAVAASDTASETASETASVTASVAASVTAHVAAPVISVAIPLAAVPDVVETSDNESASTPKVLKAPSALKESDLTAEDMDGDCVDEFDQYEMMDLIE